jgi:alpha-tubulin suppressor-like RCC1 family protein
VVCWGDDGFGQSFPPPGLNGSDVNVLVISAGDLHTCALIDQTVVDPSDGSVSVSRQVVCWGDNSARQLLPPSSVRGSGDPETEEVGVAVAIAAGDRHTCAIQGDSSANDAPDAPVFEETLRVICWGSSFYGQITPPDQVDGQDFKAIEITAGWRHSCARQRLTGAVVCWGDDSNGQISPPDSVNGEDGSASSIAAGWFHSCAINAETELAVCWGESPVYKGESASAISAGDHHACALAEPDGAVTCWGFNFSGQAVAPNEVNGEGGTAFAVTSGSDFSCALKEPYGKVVCWGSNRFEKATPPDSVNGDEHEDPTDLESPLVDTASAIVAGHDHACAIQKSDGAVVCWGNPESDRTIPHPEVDGSLGTATAISAGNGFAVAIAAPEPGANLLRGSVLLLLGAWGWRRRRVPATKAGGGGRGRC